MNMRATAAEDLPYFEIGLVMAGAISAGAYTAGVMDFLLEALDEWQSLREKDHRHCPPHRVKIRAMSGASAGGMTAGVTVASMNGEIEHVRSVPTSGPVRNSLYTGWVQKVDITALLDTKDLKTFSGPIRSLFDSTILDAIAADAFAVSADGTTREYISDPFDLFLSVTNLRGVPYNIGFKGATEAGHDLSMRADYVHFYVGSEESHTEDALRLDHSELQHRNWELLKQAALASGAFPGGLAPRVIRRNISAYSKRKWPIPVAADQPGSASDASVEWKTIIPNWPVQLSGGEEYTFLSVDGGLLDNEPLELARRAIAGGESRNPREGIRAHRALLMIDPFPYDEPFDPAYEIRGDLFSVIPQIFSSLRSQARFKPDELMLAQREDVYSRFLIAPKRRLQNGMLAEYPMASNLLEGFGGFLSRSFREHDFQLGRRNCQWFLKNYFVLPFFGSSKNPLFALWNRSQIDRHRVVRDRKTFLPVVPLVGTASEEVKEPQWPVFTKKDLDSLRKHIRRRADAVVSRSIQQHISGSIARFIAHRTWSLTRSRMLDTTMSFIEKDLIKHSMRG